MDRVASEPKRELLQFIAITYVFSWLLWAPQVLRYNGFPDLPEIVGLPGMFAPFGPALAAFWLTWRRSGRSGAKTLWLRGWRLDFPKKWLAPALLLGPVTGLVTAAFILAINGTFSWEFGVSAAAIVPVFLMIFFTNAMPEEYGWRGYALDRLQQNGTALGASLALGLIWALWHLPLFYIEGTTQAAIPMYQFILQTMVLSVFYTWLYNNTGGSVLVVGLFHASLNTAAAAIPFWVSDLGRWMDFGLLLALAAIVVWHWGPTKLSRSNQSRGTDGEV